MTNNNARAGFTLIELVVSITLMAVILALLSGALRVIASAWDQRYAQLSRQDMLARGLDAFRRDVAGLQRVISLRGDERAFRFKGTGDMLKFVGLEPPWPDRAGLYVIRYNIRNSGKARALIRSRSPYDRDQEHTATMPMRDAVPLLEGALRFRFAYADTRTPNLRWVQDWPYKDRLPGLIRLEVFKDRAGRNKLASMVASVRIDAEADCLHKKPVACTLRSQGVLRSTHPGGAGTVQK